MRSEEQKVERVTNPLSPIKLFDFASAPKPVLWPHPPTHVLSLPKVQGRGRSLRIFSPYMYRNLSKLPIASQLGDSMPWPRPITLNKEEVILY